MRFTGRYIRLPLTVSEVAGRPGSRGKGSNEGVSPLALPLMQSWADDMVKGRLNACALFCMLNKCSFGDIFLSVQV